MTQSAFPAVGDALDVEARPQVRHNPVLCGRISVSRESLALFPGLKSRSSQVRLSACADRRQAPVHASSVHAGGRPLSRRPGFQSREQGQRLTQEV